MKNTKEKPKFPAEKGWKPHSKGLPFLSINKLLEKLIKDVKPSSNILINNGMSGISRNFIVLLPSYWK